MTPVMIRRADEIFNQPETTMLHKTTSLIRRGMLAAAILALASPAFAQTYPSRPVKLVVPYPAGGPIDGVARGLAERLSKAWGQPVSIDNRDLCL